MFALVVITRDKWYDKCMPTGYSNKTGLPTNNGNGFQKGHPQFNFSDKLFKKGHKPWNKNLKGLHHSPKTEFKKGNKSWNNGMAKKKQVVCFKCGKIFITNLNRKRKFCSRECSKLIGDNNPSKKLSVRKKLSETKKGILNPNWKGGISPEESRIRMSLEYNEWRKDILLRDNYTCQDCKIRGGILEVHHIKSFVNFQQLRLEISNGITLCKKCHNKIPKGRPKIK